MSDPLVHLLIAVRKAHQVSQRALEDCMTLPAGTLRHIERGRRLLPESVGGLVQWVREFENCVGASLEERQKILEVMSRTILDQFALLLQDIEQGRSH